jgi:mono/diheme cytochrome c family protein
MNPRLALASAALLLAGCDDQSMRQQKRYETYAASQLWPDGTSARPLPAGVIAQGDPARAAQVATPPDITPALLARGRERYEIFCTPCHGYDGKGDGMIVQRGFPKPPSYHSDRLRAAPARYMFDVITNGYGVMYSYAARVPPEDRWAIVAYIRALQLSQRAQVAEVPGAREKLP